MIETVKIPEERRGVLIGPDGSVKKQLEDCTKTRIRVGDAVEISGTDVEGVLKAKNVIKAIGRGFAPECAFLLLEDGFEFYSVSLEKENKNTIKRLMGRVIGREGNTRKIIEQKTNCKISVYGKQCQLSENGILLTRHPRQWSFFFPEKSTDTYTEQ